MSMHAIVCVHVYVYVRMYGRYVYMFLYVQLFVCMYSTWQYLFLIGILLYHFIHSLILFLYCWLLLSFPFLSVQKYSSLSSLLLKFP